MPRYFFDVAEGGLASRDEDGLDLPDFERAKTEAMATLPDLARESPARGEAPWRLVSSVRDETGRVVFEASLSFEARTYG